MTPEPQDFARCAGNPALGYCPLCKRKWQASHRDEYLTAVINSYADSIRARGQQ